MLRLKEEEKSLKQNNYYTGLVFTQNPQTT